MSDELPVDQVGGSVNRRAREILEGRRGEEVLRRRRGRRRHYADSWVGIESLYDGVGEGELAHLDDRDVR